MVKKTDPSKIYFILSFICFALFGILFGASSLRAENNTPIIPTEPLATIYKQSITQPLNKAASESTDPDIAKFSQNLIKSYELDKQKNSFNDEDPSSLSNLLPDIFTINKKALTAPLQQAGKLIKDKDISEFYYRFISTLGIEK
jgi:hypothetical protein